MPNHITRQHHDIRLYGKPYVVPVFIPHAGCPHRCIFCDQHAITGSSRLPTAESVQRSIERFIGHCSPDRGWTEISFFGGNFMGLGRNRINDYLSVAQEFITKKKVDGIRFSTRPDTITSDRLDQIAEYTVTTVELGVQSMNDHVLESAHRGHSSRETRQAAGLLKQREYFLGLQLMTGLPGDTRETAMNTAEKIISLAPDFVRIYPTVILSGSRLEELYRNGLYSPMTMEACVSLVADLYGRFSRSGIRVIRMGLQASESLDQGATIVAGPYHPAFGHMVFSELFRRAAAHLMHTSDKLTEETRIHVNPSDISKMRGLRNLNTRQLESEFNLKKIQITGDPDLEKNQIRIRNRTLFVTGDF